MENIIHLIKGTLVTITLLLTNTTVWILIFHISTFIFKVSAHKTFILKFYLTIDLTCI